MSQLKPPQKYLASGRLRAQELAIKYGECRYLCEFDSGEGRVYQTCKESYLHSDEFIAFDGRIVAGFGPDGLELEL